VTPDHLYITLINGFDGTPMASYAEALAETDAWDFVHFVISRRR